MNVEATNAIRVSRVIRAGRQDVFDAWTRADELKKWSCPQGATVEDVHTNPTVGGDYRIRMKTDDGKVHTAVGVYREIDEPARLVYTWNWEESPDAPDTLVTVTFSAAGDSTEVVVLHERFPDEEMAADHEMGWSSCLDNLEKLLLSAG